jgi:hypothetical protein
VTSRSKRPVGYQVTQTYCREHAPDGLVDLYEPIREGVDYGVPFICDVCDGKLTPETWEQGERAVYGA